MKIVICGSMAFAHEMYKAKMELESRGDVVVAPSNLNEFIAGTISQEKKDVKIELDVFNDYFTKIDSADAILVVNCEKKGISNYIGANALIEMAFAHVLNKKIYLLNPIPVLDYSEEIEALAPVVLNGDLSLLK